MTTQMTRPTTELRSRIEAKKKELEARVLGLKADAQAKTRETEEHIRARLNDLQEILSDGWERMSEESAKRLNRWLKDEEDGSSGHA